MQLVQLRIQHLGRFLGGLQLGLGLLDTLIVRCIQAPTICLQTLAPHLQLLRLLLQVALIGREHLQLLLDLDHLVALRISLVLRGLQRFFIAGQLSRLLLELRLEQCRLLGHLFGLFEQGFTLEGRLLGLLGPVGDLVLQLRQALLRALAALHHIPDLGFQTTDLR